jgi:8-oxo-dGTP pyrophosphatase MutT (NUDIX family)
VSAGATVAVQEAATVMLVRDASAIPRRDAPSGAPSDRPGPDTVPGVGPGVGPGIEVFMQRRNPASTFVPGAYVFPGGRVDPGDADPRLPAAGFDAAGADAACGGPGAVRYFVAAVREAFEEAGVLLARHRGDATPFDAETDPIGLAAARARLLREQGDLASELDALDAVLDLGALVPFGRWITPVGAPKRYDTWFFVASAPDGHTYAHDDVATGEMVASEWVRPADALARARAGGIELIYPTIRSLLVLARFRSAAAVVAAARARWHRPAPLRVMDPDGGWQLDLTTDFEHAADDAASGFVMRMGPPPAGAQ